MTVPVPAIEVRNLTKDFDSIRAVDDISFTVPHGQIVGLLGGNGAGKTTTISMILGALLPTTGQISVMGHDMLHDRFAVLARMNFASPYVNLPLRLTVKESLKVYGLLYGLRQVEQIIDRLATELDLQHLLKTQARHLSAGQKTRVTLAKALINSPDVLLLDEPTASLDPDTADFIRGYLERYAERTGCAILLASHNMQEVERLCEDILIMKSGRIKAHGTAAALCMQYKRDSLEDVFLDIARTPEAEASA
jgi:ABC-2 type transport system ATP-binding protein